MTPVPFSFPRDARTLIDRKIKVTTAPGQLEQLRRQVAVLKQNAGYKLRIEVPSDAAARATFKAIDKAGVRNSPIDVRVVPLP